MTYLNNQNQPLMETKKIETIKIGKFTIIHTIEGDVHKVTMSPGTLFFKYTRNLATSYHSTERREAHYHIDHLCLYAKNETVTRLWERLNNKPFATFLRYQHLIARHNDGKWVRGINIFEGKVTLNYE